MVYTPLGALYVSSGHAGNDMVNKTPQHLPNDGSPAVATRLKYSKWHNLTLEFSVSEFNIHKHVAHIPRAEQAWQNAFVDDPFVRYLEDTPVSTFLISILNCDAQTFNFRIERKVAYSTK